MAENIFENADIELMKQWAIDSVTCQQYKADLDNYRIYSDALLADINEAKAEMIRLIEENNLLRQRLLRSRITSVILAVLSLIAFAVGFIK